jgi:SAM-dependent methyltransferase
MTNLDPSGQRPPSLDEVRSEPFYEKDLEQMARAVNYLQWQYDLIAPHISGSTLEIGGGIGNFTRKLARDASRVVSIEPNSFCYQRLHTSVAAVANIQTFECVAEELTEHIGPTDKFDTVVCLNVLEHIADDLGATMSFAQHLKPGGKLVLQIPALGFLFGEIDRRLGHYRRYNKNMARELFARAGLIPVQLRYFNFIGAWAWLWNAHVTKAMTQSDFQIKIFDQGVVPWTSILERVVHPPLGQCLLAVAKKPSP